MVFWRYMVVTAAAAPREDLLARRCREDAGAAFPLDVVARRILVSIAAEKWPLPQATKQSGSPALHQIYSFPGKDNQPSGPKIKIDGKFDGITATWIKHFQGEVKKKGKSILADGRVDPAKGAQFTASSISNTHYTISFLNFNHCSRYRQDHNHLEKHPLIPGALKTQLGNAEPKAPGA